MTIESQKIEYKDFSKIRSPNKKKIISKLFKEITAFSNSKGGKIIVGIEDKTGRENPQPQQIIQWLDNDLLTSEINRISDNLVNFKCIENNGLITIEIPESEDVISANIDYTDLNKGDCFIRQNHEVILAKGEILKKIIEIKSISTDSRLKKLREIVHYKFSIGENAASKLNIFDSLVIVVDIQKDYINTVFDTLVQAQFNFDYSLPISKHSTIQVHAEMIDKMPLLPERIRSFNKLVKNKYFVESFFDGHRENVLTSINLKNYILEYKNNIEK
ncbi:ATP-binding protein [Aquimarina sp. 2201CG5-10]|uniref:ATP-binding protein n=1 Tax=Aquimarina callyspongiae TaxID=3098150 RepID=UPI002AB54281|nr:ATP-binding protein [Aquimarina sp. 2201CG5-10]MDY8135582.1 ATP-binding protein [Aquimarina sp. 2201CG5-10]